MAYPGHPYLYRVYRVYDTMSWLASCLARANVKHEALARVEQGCLNTSQTVLKSLRSVDLFGRLWRGAS